MTVSGDSPLRAALDSPHDVVRAFAANSAFRAAEWRELTTEANPYRRPVRPDDLEWLDYGTPMRAENVYKLSALLGHRMLRNIYDLDALYLPPGGREQEHDTVRADHDAFYCDHNRMLSALAKPVLERHLFSFTDDDRDPLGEPNINNLGGYVAEYFQRRVAEPGNAFDAVLSTRGRREAANFLLLQLSAYLPAMNSAIGRAALGEYDLAHATARSALLDEYRTWVAAAPEYATLLGGADLTTAAAAYWQLYLGSSLARGNHLHHLSVNRERFFAFLGAWVHKTIDEYATRGRFATVLSECLGVDTGYFHNRAELTEAAVVDRVVRLVIPFTGRHGSQVVHEFHRGFADAARLTALWDADVCAQVTWADRIAEHQDKAEKIDRYLSDENIEVDLDTFVESSEETSTTHVHDEHRLVMIESGRMHFWNNTTHKIELNVGDKLLIPVSRLHGSTVLSGECTYHQPIIPEEMYQKFA